MRASCRSLVLFGLMACTVSACGDDYNPKETGGGSTGSRGRGMGGRTEQGGGTERGGTTQTGTASIRIVNQNPSLTVSGLFLSPSDEEDWGPNQLDGSTIPPGASWTLSSVPCNEELDFKLVGSGNFEAEEQGMVFKCNVVTTFTLKAE